MALDLSAISTELVKFGGQLLMKRVNTFEPSKDFLVYRNVKGSIALPKLSTVGEPRPYRKDEDYTSNDAKFTDRTLTVHQSKWDHTMDPETFRNTYLAMSADPRFDPNNLSFFQYIAQKISDDYLANINDKVVKDGVYNAAGTGAADLADGLAKLFALAVTAGDLTPVATGTFNGANAVFKVEQLAASLPAWMRQMGFKIICSYTAFDYYKTHARVLNQFIFDQNATEVFKLNGYKATLEPRSWMGSSLGLIATIDNNLVMGTDGDSAIIHATPLLNLIKLRLMMPIGFQIADTDAIAINDQF